MMETKEIIKKQNPCNMWKLNKKIIINLPNAGKQEFECVNDERGEKYFYSIEANHAYHSRLFNRRMDVVLEQTIYTPEDMKLIALNKALKANRELNKAVNVMKECDSYHEQLQLSSHNKGD